MKSVYTGSGDVGGPFWVALAVVFVGFLICAIVGITTKEKSVFKEGQEAQTSDHVKVNLLERHYRNGKVYWNCRVDNGPNAVPRYTTIDFFEDELSPITPTGPEH